MLSHFFNSLVATLPLAVRNSGGVAVFVRILWVATLLTMSICTWIVVSVALQKVNHAPDTKSGSQCDNKGLQYIYCAVEKFHEILLSCRVLRLPEKGHKKRRSVLVTAAVISPRAA